MKRNRCQGIVVSSHRAFAQRVGWLSLLVSLGAGCGAPSHRAGSGGVSELRSPRLDSYSVSDHRVLQIDTSSLGGGPLGNVERLIVNGQPEAALSRLDELRTQSNQGSRRVPRTELHRLRGTAYFSLGKWGLARRYLAKGLPASHGAERSRQLARLVYSSRALGADDDVARFSRMLGSERNRADVRQILGGNDALLAAAPKPVTRRPSRVAPSRSIVPSVPSEERAAAPAPSAGKLTVLPRSAWHARPLAGAVKRMGSVSKITIHHTGDDAIWLQPRSEVASTINAIQRYHQQDRQWADIGYHYLIDRSGTIWQGRSVRYQGAHAGGVGGVNNQGNLGIVLLGNYFKQTPSREQVFSLTRLVTVLSEVYAVPPENVFTHREVASGATDCPGPSLGRLVRGLRYELRRLAPAMGD